MVGNASPQTGLFMDIITHRRLLVKGFLYASAEGPLVTRGLDLYTVGKLPGFRGTHLQQLPREDGVM